MAQLQIVDDSELLQMAAPRASELFPVFERADALSPLLLLLAILPGLYAIQYRTLDENAALWGLRSIEMRDPTDVDVYSGAKRPSDAEMLKWQPPLAPWLTSQVLGLIGTQRWIGLFVVSYLSTAALVFCSFRLARRLVGSRYAFWMALLLSFHPLILRQIQNPAPQSLAILAAVITFWAYIAHRQDEGTLVSFKLLASGIALGICLLSGGPLCLVVIATLLVHILALRGEIVAPGRKPLAERRRVWTGWPALQSLMVCIATGFAVGGWWVMMMSWQYGWEFWSGWLTGASPVPDENIVLLPAKQILGRFVFINGGVMGLTVLGLWCGCRELLKPTSEVRRRRIQFLAAWAGAALLVWLNMAHDTSVASYVLELWEGFLLLPCIGFAALGIDEISRRTVPLAGAVAASCASFAAALLGPSLMADQSISSESFFRSPLGHSILLVVLLIVSLVLATRLLRTLGTRVETRRHLLLTMLLVAQLGVNAGIGIATSRRRTHEDEALVACRKELGTVGPAERCTVVRETTISPTLWFLVRSVWPEATLAAVDSWDQALSTMLAGKYPANETSLVIDWTSRDTRPANIQIEGLQVDAVSRVQVFRGRQLRAYRVRASQDAPKVVTVSSSTAQSP